MQLERCHLILQPATRLRNRPRGTYLLRRAFTEEALPRYGRWWRSRRLPVPRGAASLRTTKGRTSKWADGRKRRRHCCSRRSTYTPVSCLAFLGRPPRHLGQWGPLSSGMMVPSQAHSLGGGTSALSAATHRSRTHLRRRERKESLSPFAEVCGHDRNDPSWLWPRNFKDPGRLTAALSAVLPHRKQRALLEKAQLLSKKEST